MPGTISFSDKRLFPPHGGTGVRYAMFGGRQRAIMYPFRSEDLIYYARACAVACRSHRPLLTSIDFHLLGECDDGYGHRQAGVSKNPQDMGENVGEIPL